MEEFNLDKSFLVATSSGSTGSQMKYKYNNKWFKVDTNGYELIAEVLACCILEASNCNDYVRYHRCIINGRNGCYSESFLKDGERLMTFEDLYYFNTGESLTEKIMGLSGISERIQFVKSTVAEFTGIDVSDYVDVCLSLDYITRNGDRHLNNFAVIEGERGYRVAPVFDNGDAFFSNYSKFEPWCTLDECLDTCTAKPFSGSFDAQFSCIKNSLKVDYQLVRKLIGEQPEGRGKQTALYLIEKYRNIFCNDTQEIKSF